MPKSDLNKYEWSLVLSFSILVIILSLYTHFSAHEQRVSFLPPFQDPPIIVIEVKGEVKNPGRYNLKKGGTMASLLAMAEPTSEANLEKIDMSQEIRESKGVKISRKTNLKKKSR